MNEPWNRFVLPPLPPSIFDEDIGSSAVQAAPTGGILGNFGQSTEPPPMGLRPAAAGAAALPPSVLPPWTHAWPSHRLRRPPTLMR
jgi:hypothetical protein